MGVQTGRGDDQQPLMMGACFVGHHDQMGIQQPSAPKGDPILSDGHDVIRTGTVLSAVAHIIAAVIGAGVLSLAWSTAQLGWIAGPVALLCFAVVTYISVSLLSQCYMSPTGHRNPTYMDAVRFYLGRKHRWMCGLLQYLSMYGTCIAYVITTSTSMRAIEKSNCYHKKGHEANCSSTGIGTNVFMLVFGIAQIFASQIPDFHNMAWLSVVAALMSFGYASIGLGLGFATVIENRAIKGSITGVSTDTAAQKIWLSFQALADISFAYPYTLIVLEIQDTLKSPPPEHQTMNKASLAAIVITTFFYTCCGCFGYAAFGSDTPGNLLTGFGFYDPYWLVDLANACIILHLVGGYQIYCQPIYAFAEKWFSERFPQSRVLTKPHALKLPYLPVFRLNLFRVCFRTTYVASTTGIAMLFPYFNQVLGVLGAVTFWPLAIYFPVEMYVVQRKIGAWTRKWVFLEIFSMICLCVSIVGLVGSIEGLITEKLS